MNQIRKHFPSLLILSLILAAALAAPLVFAEAPTIYKPDFLPGPDQASQGAEVQRYFRNQAIPAFIAGFIGLIGALSILVIVFAGIRFIIAHGEEEAITNAKKTATYAVIGFGITIFSYAIVATVTTLQLPDEDNASDNQQEVIYRDQAPDPDPNQ
jgi:amino acid transporter